jgi:subtilisin family serine protease
MAKSPTSSNGHSAPSASSTIDDLLLAALERGDESLETGRYIVTYKQGAHEEGHASLAAAGMRVAHARDFDDQAMSLQDVGDADAVNFSELGVALISGAAFQERGMGMAALDADSPIEAIEPEHFVFADNVTSEYLRGFARAASVITADWGQADELGETNGSLHEPPTFEEQVLGATWGLKACRVPTSTRTGQGIKVAVLDTGFDLGHPEFAGRAFTTATFVGQPVQDMNGHGTHTTGTACGPRTPPGAIQRYGIGWRTPIFVGKVLTNAGSGTTATVLAGMNWAIANRCPVISMSLGAQIGVQAAYTAAGQAALNAGCLIIAAAGNAAGPTGAPANSPTIVSVASLDQNLAPSSFSNFGKVEIAAPGRDVFSSLPRPRLHGILSGTSMATPHVAGCAALLAQTSPAMRGLVLRNRLLALARALPQPAARVGRGLVQAIQ